MKSESIREQFVKSLTKYTVSTLQVEAMWNEVKTHYSVPARYYHTLTHLDHLVSELATCRTQFADWDTVVFAAAYHDIMYDIRKADNEEQSAWFAASRLGSTLFPTEQTGQCKKMILATRTHEPNEDEQINLFTDADLSIMGAEPNAYQEYTQQIRLEYGHYTDTEFRNGRTRVLEHFLDMKKIYKTRHFYDAYERKARTNLERELQVLNRSSTE